MKNKIVVGFDPGLASTGWGVVERGSDNYGLLASGIIKTPAKVALGVRLHTHFSDISDILDRYCPGLVSIEAVFHNRNISSSISTGQVIGCIEVLCAQKDIRTVQVNPQFVKSAVMGVSAATKDAMVRSVNRMFGVAVKNPHVADAVACAVAGHLKMRF